MVLASSLAVFGTSAEHPLPAVIDDHTLPNPQTSYGVQKFIAEQLLADYTRKGFLRGRAVRLATVSVRPGRPNRAASGFLSGIIREPLSGQRAVCPVPARTEVALISPARAVDALLCAAASSEQAWGGRTAVTLPALAVTVAGMVAALERAAGPEASALIDWDLDPGVDPDGDRLACQDPARPGPAAGTDPRPRCRLHHRRCTWPSRASGPGHPRPGRGPGHHRQNGRSSNVPILAAGCRGRNLVRLDAEREHRVRTAGRSRGGGCRRPAGITPRVRCVPWSARTGPPRRSPRRPARTFRREGAPLHRSGRAAGAGSWGWRSAVRIAGRE